MNDTTNTFDFQNGRGPVPAHQHPNGNGWVENTVIIPENICVPATSRIWGKARIGDNARIGNGARIGDNARIGNGASIGNWAKTRPPIQIQGTRDLLCEFSDTHVSIGCEIHPLVWWLDHYQEKGTEHNYSESQINEYGEYLKLIVAIRSKG